MHLVRASGVCEACPVAGVIALRVLAIFGGVVLGALFLWRVHERPPACLGCSRHGPHRRTADRRAADTRRHRSAVATGGCSGSRRLP